MRVLLINTNTIKPPIPPIGLEYIAEYLRDNKIQVFVFDLCFQKGLKKIINKIRPDFIGIGIRNTDDCSFPSSIFFLPKIKKLINDIKELTASQIVLGGVGFSVMPEDVLKYLDVKFGIYGDGEESFLRSIKEYPNLENIPNLVYRTSKGEYKKNKQSFLILKN